MYYDYESNTDFGKEPYVFRAEDAAQQNQNFQMAVWIGCHLQMTLMYIPPCGEIGLENHPCVFLLFMPHPTTLGERCRSVRNR